jgi:transposase
VATTGPFDAKLAALRAVAAAHPHPQAVTDPLFQEHPFFDARDLVQVKYEMLRRVQADGTAVVQAAATFGLSRPAFYQAQAAFTQGGLPGLVPRRRGPRGGHKLTDHVLAFLEQRRAAEPGVRTVDLVQQVRERFGVRVHRRSIERGLARRLKKRLAPAPA